SSASERAPGSAVQPRSILATRFRRHGTDGTMVAVQARRAKRLQVLPARLRPGGNCGPVQRKGFSSKAEGVHVGGAGETYACAADTAVDRRGAATPAEWRSSF